MSDFMAYYTRIGDGPVSLGIIALLYWNHSRSLGLRVGVLLMVGGILNGLLKLSFAEPRPAWSLSEPASYQVWNSFGMPSGHAQSSTIWFLIARDSKRVAVWLCVLIYAFTMGYSRVVLAAHSWTQVVAGWVTGICLVMSFIWFEDMAGRKARDVSWTVFILVLGVFCLGVLSVASATIESIPAERLTPWHRFSSEHAQDLPSPAGLRSVVSPLGALLGLLAGAKLDDSRPALAKGLGWGRAVGRALIGGTILIVCYALLRLALPSSAEDSVWLLCRGFGAAGLGYLVTAGMPALFRRIEQGTGPAQSM